MRRFAIAVFVALCASAQQHVVVDEPVYVTAIELVADVRDANGEVPAELNPSDFILLEDGVEQTVIGVDSFSAIRGAAVHTAAVSTPGDAKVAAPAWQIVIFFDTYLSSAATIKRAVETLDARAEELARLGPVSIVLSNPALDFRIVGARDAAQIRETLRGVRASAARNWLVRHRLQFQHHSDMARGGRPRSGQEEFIRAQILAEVDAVERFQSALLTAIGRFPRKTPQALFVISEGFELNAASYYEQFSTDLEEVQRMHSKPLEYNVGDTVDEIARILAAAGWTTIGIHAPLGGGEQWIDDAGRSSIGRVSAARAKEALFASERGNDPLIAFAAETGGTAGTPGTIGKSVERLEEAVIISYQVSRQPDGKPRSIEIRSRRGGLRVRSFRWATESTPSELAATRTVSLLSGSPASVSGGDLPTSVSLAWTGRVGARREGQITVRSSLQALAPLLAGRPPVVRVTIAVARKNLPPTIVHRMVTPRTVGDPLSIRIPIEAANEHLDVAATVEELTSGLWGGRKAGS